MTLPEFDLSYVPPRSFTDPERPDRDRRQFINLTGPRLANGRNVSQIVGVYGPGSSSGFPATLPSDEFITALLRPVLREFLLANKAYVSLNGEKALAVAGTFAFTKAIDSAPITDAELHQFSLRGRLLLVFHNNHIYIFAFGTDDAQYDDLVPAFTRMMESVRWLTPPAKPATATPNATPGTTPGTR